jgi:hypothetical protein
MFRVLQSFFRTSLLTFTFFILALSTLSAKEWSHLELGAGNYGGTGVIDETETYIPNLRKRHPDQYLLLFNELDALIHEHGPEIIFYVNDIFEDYAIYAAVKLRDYAVSKGYEQVKIRVLPGDFRAIKLPLVNSAHLRNPEPILLINLPFQETQALADISENGLDLTTYWDILNPFSEWSLRRSGIGLTIKVIDENAASYIYPDGRSFDEVHENNLPHKTYNIARKKELPMDTKPELSGRPLTPTKSCMVYLDHKFRFPQPSSND